MKNENQSNARLPAIDCHRLEDRILYSATPFDPQMLDVDAQELELDDEALSALESLLDASTAPQSEVSYASIVDHDLQIEVLEDSDGFRSPMESESVELVFIDQSVENYEQLVADLLHNESIGVEVVLLTEDGDGIEQISSALSDRSDVGAVHIISHGSNGQVQLGDTSLSTDSLNGYASQVGGWQAALGDGADILFYGCDLAADDAGEELIEAISELTGADVAASDDITGHEELGGDWEFEYFVGEVETDQVFSFNVQQNWYSTLDITSNLVAHYEFEDGSGTIATDSAGTHHATLANSPNFTEDGRVDDALDFSVDSGGTSTATIANATDFDFGSDDYTIAFWVNADNLGLQSLVSHRLGDGQTISMTSAGQLHWVIDGTDDLASVVLGGLSADNWYHVTAIRSGDTFTLEAYDGTSTFSASSLTSVGSITTGTDVTLGGSSDFDGRMDDLRFYKGRALSSTDVDELRALQVEPTDLSATASSEGGLSLNHDGGNDANLVVESDGSTDSIGGVLGGLTSMSVELDFAFADANRQTLLSYAAVEPEGNDFFIRVGESTGYGYVEVLMNGTSNQIIAIAENYNFLFDGDRHQLGFTWDNTSGDWSLYVDGTLRESGIGFAVGETVAGDANTGTLMFGQEQDNLAGGGFQTADTFRGTYYDARIFDDVRTDSEIGASYRSDLPFDEPNLIANWQFNQLSTDGNVLETVNGNNLELRQVTDPGFTASAPELTLAVDENAVDGTIVGSVLGSDAQRDALIATLLANNSDLYYNAETAKFYEYVDTGKPWGDADDDALASTLNGVNGQLVQIKSANENQVVVDILNDNGAAQAYIGAQDIHQEGEWRWGDTPNGEQFWQGDGSGDNVDGAYHNWDAGNPNDFGAGQDFAKIFAATGRWDDVDGTATQKSIIEYDADAVLDNAGSTGEQPLTYSIESQSVPGAFAIDESTGEITVADGSLLDFEVRGGHNIDIRVTDIDGNNHDETITIYLNDLVEANNAPTDLSSGIELNLDGGNNAYLQASDGGAILGGLTSVTFEATFTTSFSDYTPVISYASSSGNDFLFEMIGDGTAKLHVNYARVDLTAIDYDTLMDGQQHSVAATWDNTNGDYMIYVDGELVESGTGLAAGQAIAGSAGTGELILGQEQDAIGDGFSPGQVFSGTLYDVRIWDEARSEAEISLNHQQKFDSGSLPDGLIANWQMDGFDGSNEVVDVVGGNNLSIGNVSTEPAETAITSWTNQVGGVTASGDTLTYVDGGAPELWGSQINSANMSAFGFTDDYTIRFTLDNTTNFAWTIGLGSTESGADYTDPEYAIYVDHLGDPNDVDIRHNAVSQGTYDINFAPGGEFGLYVNGTTLEYQYNGVTFATDTIAAGTDWYIDTSFYVRTSDAPYNNQDDYSLSNFHIIEGNGDTGFIASTPVEDLHISDNATDGTSVGFVIPTDPDSPQDIVSDGLFTEGGDGGGAAWTRFTAGQSFGNWTVDSGDVDLGRTINEETPLGGYSVDLSGAGPGAISQTLNTEAGREYQVVFALSGAWDSGPDLKELRVSASGESADFSISEPTGWSSANMLWENRSFTFTADSATTNLQFASQVSTHYGAIIGDVRVIEIPDAVNAVLNSDSSLSYDAATNKFYKVGSSQGNFTFAQNAAISSQLNGVNGQLLTVNSAYENELVRGLETVTDSIWLGATDSVTEGEFQWLDGTEPGSTFWSGGLGGSATSGSFANFISGEPEDGGGAEDHVTLNQSDGQWRDLSQSDTAPTYVIEWDASEVLSSFTFSLTDDAGGRFAIDSSTGEITVANSSQMDYEMATSHDVNVQVTDAAGNTYSETMTIAIDDGFELGQSVPGAQVTEEDVPLTFTGANAITVTDGLDSEDTRLQVHITTNFNGTLTLSQTTGLTIGGGSNGGTFMSIQGTESDINAAFDGMTFTPASGYTGPVTIDVTTSLGADLEGRYQFEGDANDTGLGLVQHGTFNGNATTITDGTRGEVLSLDGTGDSVEITGMFGNASDVTLAAWVNPNLSGHEEVISLGDNIALRIQSDGSVRGFYYDSTGFNSIDSGPGAISSGSWSHVALSFDDTGNQVRLYVNGQEVDSATETNSIVYGRGTNTFIGAHGFGSGAFDYDGLIDDARIYDRALSADEIAALAEDQDTVTDSIAIAVDAANEAPYFTSLPSAEAETVESLSGAVSVTSADFDNDGDIDLVSTTNSGELRWHENDGAGNFSTGVVIATADDFEAVATYDLDGDGDMDIVAMNDDPTELGDSVYVLTNNFIGSGTVSFSTTSFEGPGGGESDGGKDLAIGDIDGDGRADIAGIFYRSIGDSQVVVFEQNSVGVWTKSYTDAISNGSGIEIVDLDNDTDLDLVVSDFQTREVYFYENDGNATAGFAKQSIHDEVTSQIFDITVADLDADGDEDIAFVTWGTADVLVMLENDGAVNPGFTRVEIDTLTGLPYHIHAADTNNDGTLDLIVADEVSDSIVVYENVGNAEFTQNVIDTNSRGPVWVEAADVDGDGQNDLVFAARDDNFIGLHVNQGDGNYIRGTVNEDVALGTLGVQIADDDAGAGLLEVTINVTNGDIILNTAGVTVLSGASSSSTVTFEGTVADLNIALANLTYSPSTDFNGIGEVQITVDDRGNTGAGGALSATESLFVEVLPQPDTLTGAHYTTWVNGSEFIVNSSTNGAQNNAETTALADGGFVVVWESYGQDGDLEGVYFQRYDSAGNAIGGEIPANTTTTGDQQDPSVIALDSGGFVITWESFNQDGDNWGSYIRTFDANGVATSGELLVNTTTANEQNDPEITALAGGGFVVVWESSVQDGDGEGVFFQRFDDTGVAQGGEIQVNTPTTGDQVNPKITGLDAGGFVIVWNDNNTGEVYAQRYDSIGGAQGSNVVINTTLAGSQNDPEVTALSSGGFVAIWESEGQDGDGNGIFGRVFNASGAATTGEIQLNSTTVDAQQDPSVIGSPDGGFVVVWESNGGQDGSGSGVFSQQFDSDGNKVNGEFQVNLTTNNGQANPDVAILNDGRMVAVWDSFEQDGNHDAVVGRILTPSLNENSPVGTVAAVVSQIVDPDSGDVYTYSLVDDAGGAFDIQADGTITVLDPSLIDFESGPTMTVTVRVTDPVSGFHDEDVTINLNNLAEAEHAVPGSQSVNEDEVLIFSAGNGNAVSVTDTLASTDARMQVTLSVNDGELDLSQLTGLTAVEGADGSGSITVNGTESDINAALEGMAFTPDANFNGAVTLNVTTALAADLEGHYTFDGSNANDQSAGTTQDGTLSGTGATITEIGGTRGEVLNLDGSGDHVSIGSDFGQPTEFTLSSWVNLTSSDNQGAEVITLGTGHSLRLDAFNGVVGFYHDGANWNYTDAGGIDLAGTGWRHVSYTVDSANDVQRLYIDGVLVNESNYTGDAVYQGTDARIGAHGGGNADFDFTGQIDDARIYTRALSADEIVALATDRTEVADSIGITVEAVNDTPGFNNLDGNPTFMEGGSPVQLDADVTIYDQELSGNDDFGGATLLVERDGGGNAEDVFTATGNLAFNGASLELSSTVVGTVINNSGTLMLMFDAGTTNAQVNEVMQSIAYSNSSDSPPASVDIGWAFIDGNAGTQGSGGSLSTTGNTTVDITPVADVPTIVDLGGDTLGYTEGDGQQAIDQAAVAVVGDVDSTDFDTGTLTVSFTAGSDIAEDVLSIINTGTGLGEIGVSGSNVTYEGAIIGTITGGSGGADLVVTLNANADHQATSALVQAISYENTDTDNPTEGNRTVRFSLTDGDGGTSTDYDTTVSVAGVNDDPTIINLNGDTLNYTENDGAVVIEQGGNAVISDVDSANFDSGTLTVGFAAGSDPAEDVIAIRNQGTGAGQVGVSGSDVTYGGTVIGSFTGGISGTDLVVTFNANATSVGVTMVMQNVTYENTDTAAPTTGARTVDFTVTDGDGGTSLTHSATVNVASENDNPVLTLNVGGGTYNEGSSGVFIDAFATVTDADNVDFDGGTLTTTITGNGESDDRLVVLHEGTGAGQVEVAGSNLLIDSVVVASFAGGSGPGDPLVITFNANADAAEVEAIAQRVAFNSVSENPSELQREVSMQLTDGDGGTSALESRTENVIAHNDTPDATGPANLSATEQISLELTGTGLNVSDPDSADGSASTTVTLSVGEGNLTGSSGDSGVVIVDSAGTLTLTGTINQINDLLAGTSTGSISYLNSSNDPSASTNLTMTINDGGNYGVDPGSTGDGTYEEDTSTTVINITAVNDAPFTGTSTSTSSEDAASVSITLGGSDSDGTIEHFVLSSLPTNGTLYTDSGLTNPVTTGTDISATGGTLTLYFAPDADWNGSTTFDYAAKDDLGMVDPADATGTITINPVNDAPVLATNNTLSINEGDASQVIDNTLLNEGDVDDDGAGITYRVTSLPAHGTLRLDGTALNANDTFTQDDIDNNRVTYDHDGSETTADSFNFDVLDGGEDGAAPLTNQTFDISIALQNEDPFNAGTLPTSVTVDEDVSTSIDFSDIDLQDPDSPVGNLTMTFTTSGGGTLSATTGGGVTVGGDGTGALTLTGTQADLNTFLNNTTNIQFTGATNANGAGADSIQVDVTDNGNVGAGGGGTITLGTTTVDIDAVNDDPTNTGSLPTTITLDEDVATDIDLSSVDLMDVDSATGNLTITLTTSSGGTLDAVSAGGVTVGGSGSGVLTLNGTQADLNAFLETTTNIQFTSASNANGTGADSIQFEVTDNGNVGSGGGGTIDLGTISIDIDAINDDPFNAGNVPTSVTVDEDVTTNVDFSAIDLQDVDSATGNLTMTFATMTGGTLNSTSSGGVTVGGSGTTVLTLTGTQSDLNSFLNDSTSIEFTGATNANGAGADSIQVQVTDNGNEGAGGGGTIDLGTTLVDINAVNDEEILSTNLNLVLNEGATQQITLLMLETKDVDNSPVQIVYTVTTPPANGTLLLLGSPTTSFTQADINSGLVSYEHNGGETISDDFDFVVDDGTGTTTSGTFNITVNPVNDAPVAVDDNSYAVDEGGSLSVPAGGVLANDLDAENDGLSVNVVGGPSNGSLILNADGSFLYTHDGTETTTDAFTYRVADGNGGEDFATVNLTINPVNDAPVANVDSYTMAEDGTLNSDVMANDFDAELDLLSADLVGDVSNGTLTLNPDGTFTYSPNQDFNGSDSFTYRAYDGSDYSADITVTVAVTPVNDRPEGGNDNFSTSNLEALVVGGLGVLANDTDVDGDPISVVLLSPPSSGNVALSSNGTFTYTPDNGFNGTTSFTYMATDGIEMSDPVTVSIDVIQFGTTPVDDGGGGDGDGGDDDGADNSIDDGVTETKFILSTPETVVERDTLSDRARNSSGRTVDSPGISPLLEQIALGTDSDDEDFINQLDRLEMREISIEFQRGIDFDKVDTIAIDTRSVWAGLEEARRELEEELFLEKFVVGSTILATTGVAASYVFWIMRGSYLVALVASSVPTWASFDPLPILESVERDSQNSAPSESLLGLVATPSQPA